MPELTLSPSQESMNSATSSKFKIRKSSRHKNYKGIVEDCLYLVVVRCSEWEPELAGASLEGRGGTAMFLAGCSSTGNVVDKANCRLLL